MILNIQVHDFGDGPGAREMLLPSTVFDREFRAELVHQVVTAHLARGRQATKAHRTRAQVRGGGRKPWRQKGSGRARAGSIRSPLWKGGGVAFAVKDRNYSQKVNRKMYHGALACIFSELVRQERLIVVSALHLARPKTRDLLDRLARVEASQALIVTKRKERNLSLSARNLPDVDVCSVRELDPVALVGSETVVATEEAVAEIAEWLS